MPRFPALAALLLAFAVGASAPAFADTAPTPPKKKPAVTRHVKKWTTPPGYRSPEQIERQEYEAWRRDRRFAWRHNVPQAYYFYYGEPYYNGRFGANRRDSWHVGPCWTQTPIGAVWNCGK
ncbi:MAG: hypothetical protein Q8M24_07520 [Pseudolabrys sp.]|nr:hypothetical protein [Pseudolabrys sp.]MDP2295299.1 hypothetical protein [Pseudolabrys sp.]